MRKIFFGFVLCGVFTAGNAVAAVGGCDNIISTAQRMCCAAIQNGQPASWNGIVCSCEGMFWDGLACQPTDDDNRQLADEEKEETEETESAEDTKGINKAIADKNGCDNIKNDAHRWCCAAIQNGQPASWNGIMCSCKGMFWDGLACQPTDDDEIQDGGEISAAVIVGGIRAGDACPESRLPENATAGEYVQNGVNESTGSPKWVCHATGCKTGTYLVVNASGASTGKCSAPIECPADQTMNIIDGTRTDLKCVGAAVSDKKVVTDDDVADKGEVQAPTQTDQEDIRALVETIVSGDTRNNCERGVAGWAMFENKCLSTAEIAKIRATRAATMKRTSAARADAAYKSIKTMLDGFNVTVWRDADGNFNTSRLVSDSVAGVVLGTVGGVVTSNVIKKNQIKTGLEDISCTVGDMTVAGYGDEFTVGIQ